MFVQHTFETIRSKLYGRQDSRYLLALSQRRKSENDYFFYCFWFLDGKFGAMMQVYIQNDGPVTLEIESPGKNVEKSRSLGNGNMAAVTDK